jgi:hypothetical protein
VGQAVPPGVHQGAMACAFSSSQRSEVRMTSRDRLRALGVWADRLEAPDFDFGHWVKPEQRADGAWTMPYFAFSAEALEFLKAAPIEVFAWPNWMQTDEAQQLLADHTAIAQATDEQLVRLLTALIRGDRFGEGTTLAGAYESGLLAGIARRARELGGQDRRYTEGPAPL